jgi:hypothetical protein
MTPAPSAKPIQCKVSAIHVSAFHPELVAASADRFIAEPSVQAEAQPSAIDCQCAKSPARE